MQFPALKELSPESLHYIRFHLKQARYEELNESSYERIVVKYAPVRPDGALYLYGTS